MQTYLMRFLIFAILLGSMALAHAEKMIIIDNQSGHILASAEANARVPVASLTKVATAIVAIDAESVGKIKWNQTVAVPASAVRNATTNTSGLQEGDVLSIRDLLYCAMLASDNVAANTVAHHVGLKLENRTNLQPIANFVSHMNALARSLKMRNTRFLNPSGLDSGKGTPPYSTAADMARLTRYAYTRPGFHFFVEQRERVVNVVRDGQNIPIQIKNTNELLGQEHIDGVKTGRTRRAGDCLILSSELPPEVKREGTAAHITPRRITVVLLGSQDRFPRGLSLTRRGWQLYNQWAAQGRPVSQQTSL